ncbi:MAG: FecR domain-containing protein [Candidatus Lambdaproteobacteria bacterium]|nr:FecR domain-containing protein [Candidatus Lambdaproteobacteria bacterium]
MSYPALQPALQRGSRGRGGPWIVPALMLALLGAALLLPHDALAAVGELTVLKGQATVFRGTREITVRRRIVLEADDRVRTAPESKVHLRFHAPLQGSDAIATTETEFQVRELTRRGKTHPVRLVWGAIRSRLAAFPRRTAFMQTGTAVIGIKGTDFIVYVKRQNASEFIGVDGLIEAVSRSQPDYSIQIGTRQWGEIVEGEKPKPPIHVPDELWFPALQEFSFPGETPPTR